MNRLMTLILFTLLVAAACGQARAVDTADPAPHKVWVCKYVGTPGVDERLQTGENPIAVDESAIPVHPVKVGSEFADAQGRSLVVGFVQDNGGGQGGEPPPTCPQP